MIIETGKYCVNYILQLATDYGVPNSFGYSAVPEEITTTNDNEVHTPTQEVNSRFAHLRFANQTYTQHMKDSMHYSWLAFKASMCFLVHSFYPDVFQHNGSDLIISLNGEILEKYSKNVQRISEVHR